MQNDHVSWHRRQFLKTSLGTAAALAIPSTRLLADESSGNGSARSVQGKTLTQLAKLPNGLGEGETQILHPRGRSPLSFIIDDSTCLVNMAHFCMPQFAEAWPDREIYKKPWQKWPREIPDAFVRTFGQWCADSGVKGKYSIVPYPACVAWLDRFLPGWSAEQLRDSLGLVRDLMLPNWDIHPEMISHTRVIDVKAGRPLAGANPATMENSYPQTDISTDQLAEYLAYALRVLKNCGLPCEGITTPGGFGNRVKGKLPLATFQAVRDTFATDLPHFFKYVAAGDEPTDPEVIILSGASEQRPEVVVNVPAGTGDWFGGWDGDRVPTPDKYASADAQRGRMVELIERGDPAIMLCHWPGLYNQGQQTGYRAFQQVVNALHDRFASSIYWMKVSEIARYWAARRLANVVVDNTTVRVTAPYPCKDFTLAIGTKRMPYRILVKMYRANGLLDVVQPGYVPDVERITAPRYGQVGESTVVCVDLAAGVTDFVLEYRE